jgi:hypothetical protein
MRRDGPIVKRGGEFVHYIGDGMTMVARSPVTSPPKPRDPFSNVMCVVRRGFIWTWGESNAPEETHERPFVLEPSEQDRPPGET